MVCSQSYIDIRNGDTMIYYTFWSQEQFKEANFRPMFNNVLVDNTYVCGPYHLPVSRFLKQPGDSNSDIMLLYIRVTR